MHQPIPQEQHEVIAITCLISFLEGRKEDVIVGKINGDSRCGKLAKIVDDVIWCYFDDRRNLVNIDHPSALWSVNKLLDFIEEIVMARVHNDRPELLRKNWEGKWNLVSHYEKDNDEGLDNSGYDGFLFPE